MALKLERLKSQLASSGVQQTNPSLFQVISQLIDAIPKEVADLQTTIDTSSSGLADRDYLTHTDESVDLINSRELLAGARISFDDTVANERTVSALAIDQLTGDVTAGPGSGSQVATIANDAVTSAKIDDDAVTTGKVLNAAITFAKIQDISTDRLLGRDTAGTGDVEEIQVAKSIVFTGAQTIELSGDEATPGNEQYYGTDNTGTKGFFALPAAGGEWDFETTKVADDSITNSDVLVNDSELQFSTDAAGSVWLIEFLIVYSGNSTAADYKCAIAVAAGTMYGTFHINNMTAGNAGQNNILAANAAAVTGTANAGTDAADSQRGFTIRGIMSFTNNTTCSFQFAQNTATPATTSKTRIGSIVHGKRLV